ncbi:MAG: class I SAM-dependent methyltransferase family protein [Candidatus Woesearchaeota archaeon]|nr:class I SAM-dependent methyltransferase family protein [Candidatus Woesearchaeota archaeon]
MTTLKEALAGKLDEREISIVPSSFEIVGDIIIFSDFPEELKKKEKLIGETLLSLHKNVKVVAKKTGKYSGEFRTPKIRVIAGEKRKETTYRENNTVLKFNVEKVYFSSRLSEERKRIAGMVKPGEKVLVMFSGCGPYPLVIARNSRASAVFGIEKNPVAHRYALENIKLNKAKNVFLIKGDASAEAKKLAKKIKFDRILMPLPKGAEHFLPSCFSALKKGGIVHFYTFLKEEEIPDKAANLIKKAVQKEKKKARIIAYRKCGHYSPAVYRVCIDFKVL